MQKELAQLKKAIILQRVELQAEGKRPWDGKATRIKNFIAYSPRPIEIEKFKTRLPARLRAKVIIPAKVKQFDPRQLKSAQHNVVKRKLKRMLNNPDIAASRQEHEHYGMIYGIVAKCKDGDYIYDSNHRACVNLLCGRMHKAHYIDLTNIDELLRTLKNDDHKQRTRGVHKKVR